MWPLTEILRQEKSPSTLILDLSHPPQLPLFLGIELRSEGSPYFSNMWEAGSEVSHEDSQRADTNDALA